MQLLVINCGSSSLKFELFSNQGDGVALHRLFPGQIERIRSGQIIADHGAATKAALKQLHDARFIDRTPLAAIGHRVVHGGPRYVQPARIDELVLAAIASAEDLAPLHNDAALRAIGACGDAFAAGVPMFAVFDTAFHATMPPRAREYALSHDLADKHRIRRYGFHGLAHRSMAERTAAEIGRPLEDLKLITLQLGSGCSATAIDAGRSIDTTMGYTPLEGLMMGTRSGDVDPSIITILAQRENVRADDVLRWLNETSGLLGVSGTSADTRELLRRERDGDERAAAALEMFCYRARKAIGAYLAALNGADAIVFGGGIGQNAADIRARICRGMDWCGLQLDEQRNRDLGPREGRISSDSSSITAHVVAVDEEILIARDVLHCLQHSTSSSGPSH